MMNRDEIIKLAREAGFFLYDLHDVDGQDLGESVEADDHGALERFYAIAVVKEREARQDAQSQCEELKARIVKAGVERRRAVMDEREACAKVCEGMHEEDRPGDYADAIRSRSND